jgi:hypothetical protein
VTQDGLALSARDLLDLFLPALGVWVGHVLDADHAVEDQIVQPILLPTCQ